MKTIKQQIVSAIEPSMKLQIEIKMDNAAFDPDAGSEVARILRDLADQVDGADKEEIEGFELSVRDVNGNRVGRVAVVT